MEMSNENKVFAKLLIGISIPIAVQQLINTAVNMLDIFMIGQLGEAEIAATGLANQIFFLFTLLTFGINSGASIFMAQFWGRNEIKNIHKTMGICFTLSVLAGILFACGGIFFPEEILAIYSQDAEVIRIGSGYLRIVSGSYIITGVSTTFGFALRSIGDTKLPMFTTLISLFCNGIFNSILIFGLLGVPAMGVNGAAIATFIARTVELVLLVFFVYKLKFPVAASIKEYFSFKMDLVKIYFGTAGFVILNEIMWSMGTSMYNVGYKFAGTHAQAAVQIAGNIQNLFYVISIGIGSAAAIMLGNLLGAGQKDLAMRYSKKFYKVITGVGIACAVILLLTIPLIISMFNVTEEVYGFTYKILIAVALFLPFKCVNHLIIVGILRSGGDTTFSLILDGFGVWVIGVPMAFLGTLVFKLPIYYVVALVFMEEPIKLIFGYMRVKTNKWVKGIQI